MGKARPERIQSFEGLKQVDQDGIEYWSARELMAHFGYSSWEKFSNAIERARKSVQTSGMDLNLVFRQVVKHYKSRNRFGEFDRTQPDYHIVRYGCYILAQNGDPTKEAIASAQAYFAIQTRRREVDQSRLEAVERLEARRKLSDTEREFAAELFQRHVTGQGIATIRSLGDKALFGGKTTTAMKQQLQVSGNRPLADFLPTVTIKAKDLAAEITTHNTKKRNLSGTGAIGIEHQQNNSEVRRVLVDRGIKPEELPPAEDTKVLQRKIKQQDTLLSQPDKPLKIDKPKDFDDTI